MKRVWTFLSSPYGIPDALDGLRSPAMANPLVRLVALAAATFVVCYPLALVLLFVFRLPSPVVTSLGIAGGCVLGQLVSDQTKGKRRRAQQSRLR